jgi:hypothetical protein
MGGRARVIAWLATAAVLVVAPLARANTEEIIAPSDPLNPQVDSGWQAGTCSEEPPESAKFCSVATPGQFFETAAGHPKWGFTQFIVKHTTEEVPGEKLEKPVGEVATIRVGLPVGLSVNPGATEQCPLAVFESGAENCLTAFPGSRVGESQVTTSLAGKVTEPTAPLTKVSVYNVVPIQGEAARFGLELGGHAATKCSCAATSPGQATTTRVSPSTFPSPCPQGWEDWSSRIVSSSKARPATAPS